MAKPNLFSYALLLAPALHVYVYASVTLGKMPFPTKLLPISLGDCLSFKLQNWKISDFSKQNVLQTNFLGHPANILLVKIYVKPMIS